MARNLFALLFIESPICRQRKEFHQDHQLRIPIASKKTIQFDTIDGRFLQFDEPLRHSLDKGSVTIPEVKKLQYLAAQFRDDR